MRSNRRRRLDPYCLDVVDDVPPAGRQPRRVTPAQVAACATVVALLFVAGRLAMHDGDPTAFVHAGAVFADRGSVPDGFDVDDDLGYDGQFSYRLARSPWDFAERVDGIRFDRPAYRHQRITYPALAWAAALGGRTPAVPWTLIAVNVLAIGAIGGLGAAAARDLGRSPWYGLAFAAWPGLTVALARDLNEVVEAALLLAAVLALRRERFVATAVLLSAAVLARETALVLAAACIGAAALGVLPRPRWLGSFAVTRRPLPYALVGTATFAVYGAWQLILGSRWDEPGGGSGETADFFTIPLTRLVGQLVDFVTNADTVGLYQLVQLVLVVVACGLCVGALADRDAGTPVERLALVAATVAVLSLPTWSRAVVYLRYPDDLIVIGLVVLLAAKPERVAESIRARTAGMAIAVLWASTAFTWIQID